MNNDAISRALGKRTWGARLGDCVVLIDDSIEIVETTRYLLTSAGYQVQTAEDGMTGLGLVRRLRPRVVILDLFVPHMSGYEVIDTIRSDESLEGVFIIVITGMARDERELLDMGDKADLCLPKPIDDEKLLEAVAGAFGSQAVEPGLRKHIV